MGAMRDKVFSVQYSVFSIGNEPTSAGKRGFTLIEIALAMLALSLGVLAIFGLGRLGLQAEQNTNLQQRCDTMAEAIFDTLHEQNSYFIQLSQDITNSFYWTFCWSNTIKNTEGYLLPFPPLPGMHSMHDATLPLHFTDFTPAFRPDNISLLEWNPFYQLNAIEHPDYKRYFSNANLTEPDRSNCWRVRLVIYPDPFTYLRDPFIYQTTLSMQGGL